MKICKCLKPQLSLKIYTRLDPNDKIQSGEWFLDKSLLEACPQVYIHTREVSSLSNDLSRCMRVIECIINLTGCQASKSMSRNLNGIYLSRSQE